MTLVQTIGHRPFSGNQVENYEGPNLEPREEDQGTESCGRYTNTEGLDIEVRFEYIC